MSHSSATARIVFPRARRSASCCLLRGARWSGLWLIAVLALGCAHRPPKVPPGPPDRPALIAAPALPSAFQSLVLPNGLRVSLLPDCSRPDVAVRLFYHVGSANEAADEHGLAHLFEHLMFGATTTHSKGDFDRFIYRAGGYFNAATSPDTTTYIADLLPSDLAELLAYEADRMQNLRVEPADLEREQKIVGEELKLREENSRIGRVSNLVLREALRGHPYAHLHGTAETVSKLTLAQVQAFYARYYRPGNAHLILVGCIEPEATLAEVRRRFLPIQKGATAAPATAVPPVLGWALSDEVSTSQDLAPGKGAALAYALPPADGEDGLALLLLRELLSYSQVNRLHEDLVQRDKTAFAAGLSSQLWRRGGAIVLWAGYLPYRRRTTAFRLLAAARDRLSRLDWLTEERLAAAKRALMLSIYAGQLSNGGRAMAIGQAHYFYGDPWAAFVRPQKLDRVTLAEVRQVYQRYIVGQQPMRIYLTPQKVPLWLTLFGWLAPVVL